jgi:hypothetical protein
MITRLLAVSSAVMALVMFSITAVHAGGVGVAPARLEIADALRGHEYERTAAVVNPANETMIFKFTAEGDAADWISFYPLESPSIPVETEIIEGGDRARLLVKFNIPGDAPNGEHQATIVVSALPPEQEEAGETTAVVGAAAGIAVSLTVTGIQNLSGTVSQIAVPDAEVEYPLRATLKFRNTGNVTASPRVDVDLIRDGVVLKSWSSADTEVKAGREEFLSIEVDTTGLETGDYTADVRVFLDGGVIASESQAFALLPYGTLSRRGAISYMTLDGFPSLKTPAKIEVAFFNSGDIDTRAQFIGEVYRDGQLVDVIKSEEILVLVREDDVLAAYFKPDQAGAYTVVGYVVYEGKRTGVQEISFDVAAPTPLTSSPLFLGGMSAFLVLVVTGALLLTRKRHGVS